MTTSPFPAGLAPASAVLLDERVRPDFRDAFGTLAARATRIATAVTRVRLGTLDLTTTELSGLTHFRVLVAELNALHLDAEARVLLTRPARAPGIRLLAHLLEEGVLEVRSAPLGGWSPDFTIFGDVAGPQAVLAGFHWFQRPYPHRGPALASLHGPEGARLALRRHDELWERAHDVGPALWSLLARADARARAGVDGVPSEVPAPSLARGARRPVQRERPTPGRRSG